MLGILTFVASLTGMGLLAAPAQAAATYDGYFVYQKNWANPSNSTLHWYVYRTDLDTPKATVHVTWRAGSGNGNTSSGVNECAKNQGWLPDGKYGGSLHLAYNGSLIKGIAFSLDDKACYKHTATRDALFIHSEETVSGGQDCSTEPRCWNGDSDYHSAGCIKLKPADLADAASRFQRYYVANHHYSELLYVQS